MDISRILKTSKHIGLYFSASMIPMLINLAINPLIAMNMQPRDYAIVGFYTSFNTLISPLIIFYMLHYYTKRFFEVDEEERKKLKSTLIKLLIYFSGLLSILCFIGIWLYYTLAGVGESFPYLPYAFLSVFALPFTGLYSLLIVEYRMQRESYAFFKISLVNGLMLATTNFLFVVLLNWGAFGKLLAPFITNFLFFVFCLYKYQDVMHHGLRWNESQKIIVFCAPLTLAAILTFFTNGYDKVLLERVGNINELGYYVVGIQIAHYISVFQTSIGSTFQPDLFKAIVQRDNRKLVKVIAMLNGSTAVVVFTFILLAPFIIDILTAGRYNESVKYAQIAALSTLTSSIYYTISQITIARGQTTIPLINKIISSVLCVLMFNVLIGKYDFLGAAWGLVLSFVITFIGNIILLKIYNLKRNAN